AGCVHDDGPFGRAVGRQIVRALEGGGRVDLGVVRIELVVIRVGAGVNADGVARLHAWTAAGCGIASAAVVVVGAHDPFEGRFDFRTLPLRRVDVIGLAVRDPHRLGAGAHGDDLLGIRRGTGGAVGGGG